mmetsp:Transcript_7945/g.15456  ORF Transcript_7945/g.15456 Transcript_7945/m.15456 type:complete len:279 (+) Transcript_7945:5041-5877(+)
MILWKSSKFDLVFSREVQYYAPGSKVYCKPNVGLICGLASREEPRKLLIVGTTHILYNQRRGDIQVGQLDFMLRSLVYCRNFYSLMYEVSVLFSGDLNLSPCSPLYDFIGKGSLDLSRITFYCLSCRENGVFPLGEMSLPALELSYSRVIEETARYKSMPSMKNAKVIKEIINVSIDDGVEFLMPEPAENGYLTVEDMLITHDLALRSASKLVLGREVFPSCVLNDDAATVDYLFVSKDVSVLALLQPPNYNDLVSMGPMPNMQYPSDHFSLVFELNY